LIASLTGFKQHFNNYTPKDRYIEQLQFFGRSARICVYSRLGCRLGAEHIPAFIKVLDKADNPLIEAEYYILPEDQSLWEIDFPDKHISLSPTFIVYVDGEEKGRIVEKPLNSLEQDLIDILSASPSSKPSLDYDFFMNNYHADWDVNCSECHLPDVNKDYLTGPMTSRLTTKR